MKKSSIVDNRNVDLGKDRIMWLDTVRVLAMLMVLFLHAPIPKPELEKSMFLSTNSYIMRSCIGLFFMVSGALLLPVKLTYKEFIKKRFSRILFPTLIWSLFYLIVKVLYGDIDLITGIKMLFQIPFSAVEGVMWFMYTLIGLYLFLPFFSKWVDNAPKKELQIFIVLWLITTAFPYLKAFINIPDSDYHMMSTFSGFLGYILLGYYLRKFPIDLSKFKTRTLCVLAIFFFSVLLPAIFYFIPIKGFDYRSVLFNYLSISTVTMVALWFTLIQYNNIGEVLSGTGEVLKQIIRELADMSFGIYLVHIFVMRRNVWNLIPTNTFPMWFEIIIIVLSTLIISYIIVKLISKLSFKKYIIG